jgi:hypothetical protein
VKNKTAVKLHIIPYIVASSLEAQLGYTQRCDCVQYQSRIGRQKNLPVSTHEGKYNPLSL